LDQPQNPSRPDAISEKTGVPAATPGHGDYPQALDGARTEVPAPPAPPADAPPLGPVEWLKVNGPLLLLLLAGITWLGVRTGPMGLWKAFLVVIGVGLVIFVHELGHFLMAKWCDVHVTTFSIGFGPAIPGCSFRRGETLYKLALLPLGGYVNMVGEGPEADEDESYPRSFKNKTVGQRMLIISAGVVMNVLLGCICYIIVYRFHGELRLPAIVGRVDPGTPAWKGGVHSAMRIAEIEGRKNPYWDNLTIDVMSAPAGKAIPFVFELPDREKIPIELTPRLDPTDDKPVIGVRPPPRLILPPHYPADEGHPPYRLHSAAAAARVVDLHPGDVVVAATDPGKNGQITKLAPDDALADLAGRMQDSTLADQPLTLRVRRKGAEEAEDVKIPPGAFAYEDRVIATTDPASPDPFVVKELLPDPFPDASATGNANAAASDGSDRRDMFEFQDRMKRLAGKAALIRVRRKAEPGKVPDEVTVLVPPASHRTLGLRMTIGKVSAIRTGSPAEQAGVQEGDQLTKVVLTTPKGRSEFKAVDVDPERLPSLLAEAVAKGGAPQQVTVTLTVIHPDKRNEEKQLEEVKWEEKWGFYEEPPGAPRSPLSIPQLGLAYLVQSKVSAVAEGSPAEQAGAKPGDTVIKIRFRDRSKDGAAPKWGKWGDLQAKARFDPGDAAEQWAFVEEALQSNDNNGLQLKVKGADGKLFYLPGRTEAESEDAISTVEDRNWPLADRGIDFTDDVWLQKTDSSVTALFYGIQRTSEFIRQILLNLRAVLTGRVSTKSFGGPLQIVDTAFTAAEDPFSLLFILGVISVNLAVVNFLPIPVLDGGHMVFLIYEKLRGRRPSETVQTVATIGGIVFLISLMLFITYQDAGRFGLFQWIEQMWPGNR
jgi:regulator of sigma E protease